MLRPRLTPRPVVLILLAALTTGCGGADGSPVLPDVEETFAIVLADLLTRESDPLTEFSFSAHIQGDQGTTPPNDLALDLPSALELLATLDEGSLRTFTLRAIGLGSHDIAVESPSLGIAQTLSWTTLPASLDVGGANYVLPGETATVVSRLRGAAGGCPLAGGGDEITLEVESDVPGADGSNVSARITDYEGDDECAPAARAQFETDVTYVAPGRLALRFDTHLSTEPEPQEHTIAALDGASAGFLDGRTLTLRSTESSPNNSCDVDIAADLAVTLAVLDPTAPARLSLAIATLGTHLAFVPVPWTLVFEGERRLLEPGRHLRLTGDIRYRLERAGAGSPNATGPTPQAGALEIRGEGSGNLAIWDAPTGGNRICANFYTFELFGPVS